ncbi:MAG: HlyC/CorC family transporter [Acidobacteriales bacterium]|nr:HlyC/CorC family transporter [Terriglobales bacterium]
MNLAIFLVLVPLLGLLTLVSYLDRLYTEMGKFLSREFQNNIEAFEQEVEPKLGVSRARAALSMAVLTQLILAAITMLISFAAFRQNTWVLQDVLEAALSTVLVIVLFDRFLPFVFFSRTSGLWLRRWIVVLRGLIYLVVPITLMVGFLQSVTALTREHSDEQPDNHSEAVDALIDAGQEEGILDESNRELIQSVVEFSEKTARDAMKPRPEIVAVPFGTTVEQAIELFKNKPFSRLPVYEDSIHNIRGILYAQDVLQVPDTEAQTRSVESLMRRDVYFVPESKSGSDLLREMQKNNIRMAIVVDEYGGVAGLVTIEDLVEEIVGEISDEHDKPEVIRESDSAYIVSGNVDVDRLDDLFGVRVDSTEAATVAGLVSEAAGHIPRKGEIVEDHGLRFEVLDSTERRVERLRITPVQLNQLSSTERRNSA